MKKKILYIAAIVICLSIITSGTLAYFTAADTARNVITTGGISVRVIEQQMVNGTLQPYPSQPIPMMPSAEISKIVSIRNLEEPAWIRVNYSVTVTNAAGKQLQISPEELERVIVITPDTASWTRKNGWWQYHAAVGTGETTKPLFEKVLFSGPDMDNKYQNCTVQIDITAQAVQTAHNAEAFWPEA